ncbi:MAG: hypothetical protein WEC37_01135 [Anaerolineales bacterium]
MQRELDKYFGTQFVTAQLQKPSSEKLDDWFDYYHASHQAGHYISLKEIALSTRYSYGYVRRKHAEHLVSQKVTKK